MPKWVPKVILEGTRLTEKTETAFALNEHPRLVGPRKYRYHSPVISGEWCGFTNTPWGRGLINYAPEEEALALETYDLWISLFERLRYYSWIIDRFHLSTQAHQLAATGRSPDFSVLEERLRALDFRLVLLTRDEAGFAAARERRLRVSGNPRQYDDLSKFVAEQARLRKLFDASRLKKLELDVSGLTPAEAADRIAEWIIATGGLTMDEARHALLPEEAEPIG